MNTSPIQPEEEDTSKKKKRTYLFMAVLGFFIVCILIVYALEFLPRFVTLPIRLPKDDYASGYWDTTTYSVVYQGSGRVFAWRRYGTIVYLNAGKADNLSAIKEYFYNEIGKLGWVVGDNSDICNSYLPEANLLVERQGGYLLQFQEKGYPVYYNGDYYGDLVCVSILGANTSNSGSNQVFDITLLTARQSPLKILLDYIGGL